MIMHTLWQCARTRQGTADGGGILSGNGGIVREAVAIAELDGEIRRPVMACGVLRRDPVLIDDGDLEEVHLGRVSGDIVQVEVTLTFGVMTTIILVLTSIQSVRSNVSGSLAIMIIRSRLSALVMRYRPADVSYSSNDVPDEKKRDEASDVRDEM
jgi:hypothetical protein